MIYLGRLLIRNVVASKPIIAANLFGSGIEEISRTLSIPMAPENSSANAEFPVLEAIKRKPFTSDNVS